MTVLREIAAGVHVLRHPVLDVNATLIVGGESALVVDTLSTSAQAEELLAAVHRVTAHPVAVLNTHHHFDHCFGNDVFAAAGAPIWGHEDAAALIAPPLLDAAAAHCPDLDFAGVGPTAPDRLLSTAATVELGDRAVRLRHFGRGHSIGDVVAVVTDADVVVAGDLVEQGGPPQFDDAYPLDWPGTVAALLASLSPHSQVVPGHGAVVDARFVAAQQAQLAKLARLIRQGDADGAPAERVAERSPFPAGVSLAAVRRGYAQLHPDSTN
jgi:glyoxylase-like metal-dependent hydrolase (beta-lactamase superfamily II)